MNAVHPDDRCVGVLLAGGAARRFGGRPKGLAVVDGIRIADRALAALREVTASQLVVANDAAARGWFPSARVVPDGRPGLGPLAGIETALSAAEGCSVLVLAWDMPFVPAALLAELRDRGNGGASAVVPEHGTARRREPLCAFYAARALAACRALLDAGERRAGALTDALPDAILVGDAVLVRYGDPAHIFNSVDTPERLAALGGALP